MIELMMLVMLCGAPDAGPRPSDAGTTEEASAAAQVLDPTWRSTDGYQETRWGMTEAEVRKLVGGLKRPPAAGPSAGLLTKEGSAAGYKATWYYKFVRGRLIAVMLGFNVSPGDATKVYDEVALALLEKYGERIADGSTGPDKFIRWDVGGTSIRIDHSLTGSPFPVWVLYTSLELAGLQELPAVPTSEAAKDL